MRPALGRDRGSTPAVDAIVTVFVLLSFAVVAPWVLNVIALGSSVPTGVTSELLFLALWGLVIAALLGVGYRQVRGGGG